MRLRPPGAAVRELILPVGLVPQRLPSSRLSAPFASSLVGCGLASWAEVRSYQNCFWHWKDARAAPPLGVESRLILPAGLVLQRLPSSRVSAPLPRRSWVVVLPLGPRWGHTKNCFWHWKDVRAALPLGVELRAAIRRMNALPWSCHMSFAAELSLPCAK